MQTFIVVAGASLLLAGCTTANFRPYVGEQQTWPQSAGGIVDTRYEIPAFTCLPSADYEVLGEFRLSGPFRGQVAQENLPLLAKQARQRGADALVLVDGQQFFSAAAALAVQQQAASPQALHASEVATRVSPRGGGFRGGSGIRGGGATAAGSIMSYGPNVVVLAIRWMDGPPDGLPRITSTK